jgi:hypothetical protein
MIKIRIEGKSYYYEPASLFMYECKIVGGVLYYNPLNFCDIRIKQFI